MIEGGEVLIRRRIFDRDDDNVPLQLQLLEADFLDPFRNGPIEDTLVTQGVAVSTSGDMIGKRVEYWLYDEHPGNFIISTASGLISRPVPASEVLHCYEKQRTQARGVPWGTPSFTTLDNLAEYEEAEIVRKKTESCVFGIVTANDEADFGINVQPDGIPGEMGGAPGIYGADGTLREHFEPGMLAYAINGKTITFNSPNAIGGYNEYKVSQLRSVSAGFRVPYDMLSGDLSDTSFSSSRTGRIEFRRFITTVQNSILIPMLLAPIWRWFCEAAFLAGLLPSPKIKVKWATPAFEYVNPKDDVDSDLVALRGGLKSFNDIAYENGRDPATLLEEIAEFQKECARLGIVLDSNPGAVNGKGTTQKNPVPETSKGKKGKKSKKRKKNKKADGGTKPSDGLLPV